MSRLLFLISVLFCSAMCLITSISANADATTTVVTPVTTPEGPAQETTTTTVDTNGTVKREVIVTQTPAPKEIVTIPKGFETCDTIEGAWYNDIWVPEHKVCKYTSSTEGVAWVDGYWACTKHTAGECTNWDWKPGHWVKTYETY